jgi:DNA-3-methyladenine glycosylase
MSVISEKFFKRPAQRVAGDLLGKFLIRKVGNKNLVVKITELEIYDGFEDKAGHASRGETPRNKIMFEEGGYFYIYLIYGIYWMINIVVGKKNHPSAILLRGGEVKEKDKKLLIDGPGKLSKFLKIDKKFNEKKAVPETGLWFEDRGERVKNHRKTARIGVHYAGPVWSKKKWRLVAEAE